MSNTALTEIRHDHDVDHQARPAGKVLCPLSMPRVRIILLPCKTSLLPFAEDVLYQIDPQLGINLKCLLLVRAFRCRNCLPSVLVNVLAIEPEMSLTKRFFTIR